MADFDSSDCINIEILYLLSKGVMLEDALKIIEIKYHEKIERDPFWLTIYSKNKFGKNFDQLIYREKNFLKKLYSGCLEERERRMNMFLGKIDENKMNFLSFVISGLPWRVRNFPIIDMLVGAYRACRGGVVDKKEAFELLIKANFLPRAKIVDGEVEQWIEICETDFLSIARLLEGHLSNEDRDDVKDLLEENYIPFLDLLLKLALPTYIFPKNVLTELLFQNFGENPPREIPEIIWSDEIYYYLCPYHANKARKYILDKKMEKLKMLADKLGMKLIKSNKLNNEVLATQTKDLKIIVAPWIFFSDRSVFTRKLFGEKILETEDNLLIILGEQRISSFVKVIELSNRTNVSILSLASKTPQLYFSSKALVEFKENVLKFLEEKGIAPKNVTCEILREVFPIELKDITDFASEKFTVEGLLLLLSIFDDNVDDVENLIKKALEFYSLNEIAEKIGYPTTSCFNA